MQVKSGAALLVCLTLGLFAGDAFACTNNPHDHIECTRGVVLLGYDASGNSCVLRRTFVDRPFSCAGCQIYSGDGYIRVTFPSGTYYTCSYSSGGYSACEAYCTNSSGRIARNWYECFVRRGHGDECDCTETCDSNND